MTSQVLVHFTGYPDEVVIPALAVGAEIVTPVFDVAVNAVGVSASISEPVLTAAVEQAVTVELEVVEIDADTGSQSIDAELGWSDGGN